MPDEPVLIETARWLRYATEDLDAAFANLTGPPRHSCMLAQQSADPERPDTSVQNARNPHHENTKGRKHEIRTDPFPAFLNFGLS